MNAEQQRLPLEPTIKGEPISRFSGKAIAGQYYKEGLGQDDNPFPKYSKQWEDYRWEMGRLWDEELKALRQQIVRGL